MKRHLILLVPAALCVLAATAHAEERTQDAAHCAALQARYENDFKRAVVKAIGTLDKKERCEIGREGMAILDKLATAADGCPVQALDTPVAEASDRTTDLASRMKIVNDGESIREMVARRKASFARTCGK
jgi:hypothetical protein